MNRIPEPAISVRVDPANPGQFFACCGLLELADRLWGGAEGWFDRQGINFSLRPTESNADSSAPKLFTSVAQCPLKNTMTESQIQRRDDLSSILSPIRKKLSEVEQREIQKLEAEKKALDALWREAPIVLFEPFNVRLDWFLDARSGGSTFKTWAGQQSIAKIVLGIQTALRDGGWHAVPSEDWLAKSVNADCLPFNFDSDLADAGSDLDVGFSCDPLKIRVLMRPMLELLAFVGLQRFRPLEIGANRRRRQRRYQFALWFDPLVPQIAATAAVCLGGWPNSRRFEFQILYRTEYLKCFLPANPVGG